VRETLPPRVTINGLVVRAAATRYEGDGVWS
jgi:hypothetical protein